MAYGRLDVFWPDGLFKTYLLNDANISIGRSSGNTIALDTDTISRYHLTIARKDGEVTITDLESVNGTFIDGVKIKENQPHQVYGGEEIQIGELRVIYHDLDENPTRPIIVPEDATRRIELVESSFRIDMEGPEIPISPGAHTSAEVSITNTGDKPERFLIDASGVPREWLRIDRPELEIAPGKSADVILSFKPARRSDSKPGDYTVEVSVRPKSDPDTALRANVTLHVLPYSGFGIALETPRVMRGDSFRLHLHNQGSDTLPLTLICRDLSNSLRFNVTTTQIALGAGQRMVVQGQVETKQRRTYGIEQIYPFDLVVRSGDASGFIVAQRGYALEKPPLPSWAPFALGGIGLALIALIILGLAVLLQPAPVPVINAFTVGSARIAQGEALALNWSASNASSILISVNGTPIATADPDATSIQIDTSTLTGENTIGVIARSGSQEVTASERVLVYEPLRAAYFNTDPPLPLVRYVVQTITFNWSVPNASSTQLVGIETFSTTPIESIYGATGTVSVVGRLNADVTTVMLLAQDENGQTLQEALTLAAINPQCTVDGEVSLRNGPTPLNQVVSTLPSSEIVVVDARDQNGGWLRVQIAGGAHGWGERAAFTCASTFNLDDLQIDLNFPTPIPAPTETPTPIATPTAQPTSTSRVTPTPTPTVFVQIFVQPQVTPFDPAAPTTNPNELPKSTPGSG